MAKKKSTKKNKAAEIELDDLFSHDDEEMNDYDDYDDEAEETPVKSKGKAKSKAMSKSSKSDDHGVYRVTEVIGTSPDSWEDAAKNAVETASKTLRDLRIAEVSKLDIKVEDGQVVAYRARIMLSFKYQA